MSDLVIFRFLQAYPDLFFFKFLMAAFSLSDFFLKCNVMGLFGLINQLGTCINLDLEGSEIQ